MKKRSIFLFALILTSLLVGCTKTLVVDPTVPDTVSGTQTSIRPATGEPSEPPEEPVLEPDTDDFVRILDYIPQASQLLHYATTNNFTGQVVYEFTDAYLRYGTVKKLIAVNKDLEQLGLGLLIWDGYRPVYAQAKLYEICPDPNYVSPPGVGKQNHCRGLAVDLTLVDLKTGGKLEMPTGFDDFTALADRDYSDVSSEAAAHAQLLEEVMTRHGFQGYSKEWWHYNDTDDYPIEEVFDPAKQLS